MADNRLLRIAITPPAIACDEPAMIDAILDAGWDYVHLRHPAATTAELKYIIEHVDRRRHGRLRLHGHFELASEFNLGGLHLNSRCSVPPAFYCGSLSRSCHSVDEANSCAPSYDFVTLSPVYDSVSKVGYRSPFTPTDLQRLKAGNVVALGGITPERIAAIAAGPFAGYAVLGALFGATSIADLHQRLADFDEAHRSAMGNICGQPTC